MKLTELARKTLEAYFGGVKFEPDEETKKKYGKNGASFVTLKIGDQLRGCIGTLTAIQPLCRDVQDNALNAALHDPRFLSLEEIELGDISIEVSVLSKPKKLIFKTQEELLGKINHKMGIILKKGRFSATFLPQVWEQIPDKTLFLEHLSQKAGLKKHEWKSAETEIWCYTVKAEREK
jgi:AmmeMemoRadiSam system protein A